MKTEKFKDLYFFHSKSTMQAGEGLKEGEFPFYTSSEKLTKWINNSQFNTNALVFGTGGKASVHFANGRFSVSTDCLVASSKQEYVNIKFVFYYLFGNIHILERGFKGAGLKHISKNYIENIDIPIFPLETQNKIVSILDKASALIAKRDQSIQLLDELLTATFLDMFGDPVINPKKWGIRNLEESVLIMRDGPFGSNLKTEHYTETGVRIVRLQNIGVNQFLDSNKEYVSEKHAFTLNKHICLQGDIIVGTLGEPNLRACKFPTHIEKAINKADCIQIRPNLKIANDSYLSFLLNLQGILFMVSNYIKGQTRTRVSKGMLAKINIPIPPIELQNQFSNIEAKFEKIKEGLSNKSVPNFFQSLLQRAFNGDLNFNIDEELDSLLKEIDSQKKNNDLSKISNDTVYLRRLIDKLNNQEFKEKDQYDKAKHTVFQLLKEGKKVTQKYIDKSIQLAVL
jgi:type I restriction enzyme, S subunit